VPYGAARDLATSPDPFVARSADRGWASSGTSTAGANMPRGDICDTGRCSSTACGSASKSWLLARLMSHRARPPRSARTGAAGAAVDARLGHASHESGYATPVPFAAARDPRTPAWPSGWRHRTGRPNPRLGRLARRQSDAPTARRRAVRGRERVVLARVDAASCSSEADRCQIRRLRLESDRCLLRANGFCPLARWATFPHRPTGRRASRRTIAKRRAERGG